MSDSKPIKGSHLHKLQRRVERNREERARVEANESYLYGRRKEIDAAPSTVWTEFWCDKRKCKLDFEATGYKKVSGGADPVAWYETECPKCGRDCIRRITDKIRDPYYYESEKVLRQQQDHIDDFLTPNDPRFRQKYPMQWARLQAQLEEREQNAN